MSCCGCSINRTHPTNRFAIFFGYCALSNVQANDHNDISLSLAMDNLCVTWVMLWPMATTNCNLWRPHIATWWPQFDQKLVILVTFSLARGARLLNTGFALWRNYCNPATQVTTTSGDPPGLCLPLWPMELSSFMKLDQQQILGRLRLLDDL